MRLAAVSPFFTQNMMKQNWIVWALLLCLTPVFSQGKEKRAKTETADALAKVKGQVFRYKMKEVGLYEVVDGSESLIGKTQVGPNGWYGFLFEPTRPGYYTVGSEKPEDRIRIYLEGGQAAEVNILEDSLAITPNNTEENLTLAAWEEVFEPVRRHVRHMDYIFFTYKELFPYYMDFLPRAEDFKKQIKTKNKAFDELMRQTVDYDVEYFALCIPRAIKIDKKAMHGCFPEIKDCPDYYNTLVTKTRMTDTTVLLQPYGADYVRKYVEYGQRREGGDNSIATQLTWLPCDRLKAEIVLYQAEMSKNYERYDEVVTTFAKYLTTPRHRERMNAMSAKLYAGRPGGKAANFSYPDRNGKMVSLSDFRGKVVLVDVWATWCGPCRQEIPHLVKLEKEMEGTDVVFIGVSVDEKKDYQLWQETLDKEGLHGIQLFADGWSQIIKDYKIKGIPRFMVFGRNGRVVTIDAPRPSDPALKALLEKELKKQTN